MNLIICCTPLQVLIAEKIIQRFPQEIFFGVMLHTVENAKFNHYKQRLKTQCQGGFFSLLQHRDRISLLREIIYLKQHFSKKSFNNVFVANINELQIQFLLSAIEFHHINTFDDGTVNIIKDNPFFNSDPNTLVRKSINKLLGNRFDTQKLRQLSQQHYTLYPKLPNIIENTVGITLFENSVLFDMDTDVVNIFLGQPIYDEHQKNIELAQKVLKRFNITAYFPHPRETYKIDGIDYIHTPLIFEDYILTEFKHRKCRIYTYFSSVILNLMGKNPNIELVALKVETNNAVFDSVYDLFEELGINVIDI